MCFREFGLPHAPIHGLLDTGIIPLAKKVIVNEINTLIHEDAKFT